MILLGDRDGTARRRGPLLLLLFLALILAVVNLSNWFVLSRVTAAVEEELGRRLTTVASAAVNTATPELLLEPDVADDGFVRRTLEDVAARHDLDGVFLLDPDGVMRFDLGGGELGSRNAFLDLDFEAFTKAAAGIPSASPSMTIGEEVVKAAYAPVEKWDGTIPAVLGVTAGAGFVADVPALRRTLIGISIGSATVVGLLGAIFFGTARRLANAETALSRAETLGAMGMMAAGVAHEIRNPLAIISGTAERLRKKYAREAGEKDDSLFDFIPEEVERLNAIIEGYLRFARDEPLTLTPCDLRLLVERSTRLVEGDFAERGITLVGPSGEESVPVRADPQRIQQVLLNLFLNASQAMSGGGRVEVGLAAQDGVATIRVSDSGPGFTPKELAGAFQPFYTTKEKGSGLGLVLAKRIVEGHRGTIRLANRSGGGAEVSVELPLDGGGGPPEES